MTEPAERLKHAGAARDRSYAFPQNTALPSEPHPCRNVPKFFQENTSLREFLWKLKAHMLFLKLMSASSGSFHILVLLNLIENIIINKTGQAEGY